MREVLSLSYEFLLSLLIIGGGGYMMFEGKETALVSAIIGSVVTFWFSRRQTETTIEKMNQNQLQQGGKDNGVL